MAKIVASLAVVAVAGLTWLAYAQPEAYAKLSPPLISFLCLVGVWAAAWNAGINTYRERTRFLVQPEERKSADEQYTKTYIPLSWVFFLICIFTYLMGLLFLPTFLG